ncbi:cryptochrome [Exophiala aquamarina CBS 119918]|uniref:Cryptochrome n=1 Tax=Exophiala aquamarina CBS 119918 TaxID=1182545 RepID=A0A072PDP0_9EURO|nr:cryptochrome [Exophiala aquamarina CBS 119918]KEF57981.1 cryptochrome [Exophiala aquamarina CBS 119918]
MPPKFKSPKKQAQGAGPGPRVLYWFRTDLRLHDSPALVHALSLEPSVFIPLWCWDPHYVYRQRGAANRWNFLVSCMRDVSRSLTALNPKQKLHVVRRAPGKVMVELLRRWKVDVLVFEKDTDAYARMRDDEVRAIAEGLGVKVVSLSGRTLFDSDEVVKMNGGKPTMSMNQLVNASKKIGDGAPKKPLDRPTSLPDPLAEAEMDLIDLDDDTGGGGEENVDYNLPQRSLGKAKNRQYDTGIMGPKRDFGIPTLEEMGIDSADVTSPHKGGETAGLEALKSMMDKSDYTGTFEKPKTAPTDFEPQATTLLSPHMHFGSVSVRKFWWDVQDVLEKRRKQNKHVSGEPVNLPGQLLFRDMYFAAYAKLGFQFGQAVGNSVARFIPWHLQSHYVKGQKDGNPTGDGAYVVDDPQAEEYFRRWKEGRTGFPWIDAIMRQLKLEGWIHHLGRHAVACFLTRGGCYVSWERGAEVFEEWLIDHEVACNAGNWMWLSCTAFFSQFYRVYSPIAFGKKWDPEGKFVRKYVPELAQFDKKYIYEPYKAPIADQKAWGCIIQGDGTKTEEKGTKVFPKPMFDFNKRRQFCLDRMKEAYDVGLYGDDKRVLSGEWKKLFDFNDKRRERKEEANGHLPTHGTKRSKTEASDDADRPASEDDTGELADQGAASQDEEDEKPPRKAVKQTKPKKGAQKTLDTVVTTTRAKK